MASFPWSGGNLALGGIHWFFAWGAKMCCQAKPETEMQRQSDFEGPAAAIK